MLPRLAGAARAARAARPARLLGPHRTAPRAPIGLFCGSAARAYHATSVRGGATPSAPPPPPPTLQALRTAAEADLETGRPLADEVVAHGWVVSARHQKKRTFLELTDGTLGGASTWQVVLLHDGTDAPPVTPGQAIKVAGAIRPGRGQRADQRVELHATGIEILAPCDLATYPLANVMTRAHDTTATEIVRREPHFKARTAHFGAVSRTRARIELAMAQWFADHDYTKVTPPILTASDCEGGGEIFQVVAESDVPLHAPATPEARTAFWSGHAAYLSVSTQLHLEALALGLSRVWTQNPVFRAEGSATNRHLAEFWMLEAELCWLPAGADALSMVLDSTELMLRHAMAAAWEGTRAQQDMALLQAERPTAWLERPWPRMSYTAAVRLLRAEGPGEPPVWGDSLRSEHERWLAERAGGPLILTDYPTSIKPFYMRENDECVQLTADLDPARVGEQARTVACFDLLVPHVGELVGGSVREERHDRLLKRMADMGMETGSLSWYVDDLRRYGGAPHGGFGLGMERFLSWLTRTDHVRDIVAFPRIKGPLRY